MTSTTSKIVPHVITAYLTMIVLALVVGCLQGCANDPQTPATKTSSPAKTTQEPPKPSPAPAPAEETKEEAKPAPFYGSTFWDETLTSVYYYPKSAGNDVAKTHLKFNHREDDIWLCGDQRKFFTVGERTRLVVTFELDQDCATNWQNRVK